MSNRLLALMATFLPSFAKVRLLRLLGHQIHRSAYIGLSYLNVRHIKLAEDTYIGHGNVFTRLNYVELGAGSRINRWNRFTTSPQSNGQLVIGERTSISLGHYFDASELIEIGNDTIIGGHRSTFFTHSKGVEKVDYVCPISVGDWCYLGSNLCLIPGAGIGSHTFVGMGAVVAGDFSQDGYCLLTGNPAQIKKHLSPESPYFIQGGLVHRHVTAERESNGPEK